MNLVKPCDLASHNEQFVAHETFEEQKSMRFTDICVHKHCCIVRAYSRIKCRVKKKFSTGNRDEDKRKHSSIDYQKVIDRLRKRRIYICSYSVFLSKSMANCVSTSLRKCYFFWHKSLDSWHILLLMKGQN